MSTNHRELWDTYTKAWKVSSDAEKRDLFLQCLSEDCEYRDPLTVTSGWAELSLYMLDFHKMVPGGHFITRTFKAHNDRSIAEWDMCAGDGSVVGVGISYGEYSPDGKLISLAGFFDVPEES